MWIDLSEGPNRLDIFLPAPEDGSTLFPKMLFASIRVLDKDNKSRNPAIPQSTLPYAPIWGKQDEVTHSPPSSAQVKKGRAELYLYSGCLNCFLLNQLSTSTKFISAFMFPFSEKPTWQLEQKCI
jgi:hypothetical protein